MIIKEMPREEKPREKLLYYGPGALTNSELLAILIGTGTRDKTALRLSDEVLALHPDGLRQLQEASVEELSGLPGIGTAKAASIVAALELGKRLSTAPPREKIYLRDTASAHTFFMERLRYYPKEVFSVAMLDVRGAVIGVEDIAVGDVNSAIVQPRETFRGAIKRGASSVILAHNHPSGETEPSADDIATTKRLAEAGMLLGIKVLDHLIIGDGTFYSFHLEGKLKYPAEEQQRAAATATATI